MMRGVDTPLACSTAPAKRPWLDSTRPMPASSGHGRWQAGFLAASAFAAFLYAVRAVSGMPPAASADGGLSSAIGARAASGPPAAAPPSNPVRAVPGAPARPDPATTPPAT